MTLGSIRLAADDLESTDRPGPGCGGIAFRSRVAADLFGPLGPDKDLVEARRISDQHPAIGRGTHRGLRPPRRSCCRTLGDECGQATPRCWDGRRDGPLPGTAARARSTQPAMTNVGGVSGRFGDGAEASEQAPARSVCERGRRLRPALTALIVAIVGVVIMIATPQPAAAQDPEPVTDDPVAGGGADDCGEALAAVPNMVTPRSCARYPAVPKSSRLRSSARA